MLDFKKLTAKHHLAYLDSGHHHAHPGWAQTHCPFCAGGRSGWHLGFNLQKGNFNCWRCGPLRFWEAVGALLHETNRDALKRIVGQFQTKGQDVDRTPVVRHKEIAKPPGDGPLHDAHTAYLRGRGFDPDTLVREWGISGTDWRGDKWSWRVVIPIRNGADDVVAYQGRSIGDAHPKYRMTDDRDCLEDPDTFLYGIDKVPGDAVLIVEGVTGVWRIGPGAVATLGIDWKRAQANRLRRFPRRFVLFDPEPAAQERANELGKALSLFPGTTEIISGFPTDPGDMSEAEVADMKTQLGIASPPRQ